MSRTKGSKNKPKTNGKSRSETPSRTTTETKSEQAGTVEEQGKAEVEKSEDVATKPAEAPPAEEDNRPPRPPVTRLLAEIGHEWAEEDHALRDKENEKQSVMKDYAKAIGVLDARCAELAAEYREAEYPVTYNYGRRERYLWDGRTGLLLETIKIEGDTPIERMAPDGIVNTPITVMPPAKTFSQLTAGKVWEHDQYGIVQVVSVDSDSVTVETTDADEGPGGLTIGCVDWDAHNAYPREVPSLEVGQWWVVDQSTVLIETIDDGGVCVQRYPVGEGDPDSVKLNRLWFSAEGSKMLVLEIGERYWLDNHTGPVVTLQGAEVDGHCLCSPKDGEQEQVEVRRLYLGSKMMPEVEVPKKRAKKNGKSAVVEA